MVKEKSKPKKGAPRPVYVAAAAAICVMAVFSPDFFPAFPRRALCAVAGSAGALFAISVAAGAMARRGRTPKKAFRLAESRRGALAAIFAGTLLGGMGIFRVHERALPPITLCPLGRASGTVARLASDPVPWGKDFYRADATLVSLSSSRKDGSARTEYSAAGRMTLLIPAKLAEAALPGRVSAGRKPLYLAAGAVIECRGAVSSSKKSASSPVLFRVSEIEGAARPASLADKVLAARARARLSLLKMLYGWGDAGGLFLALCSGMREYLSDAASDAFRRAGLSHVLALSGMHLSILGGAVAFICAKLAGRRLAVPVSLCALAAFLFFAGPSPSLLRAFLFAAAVAAARRAGFRLQLLPILALVFCVHIIIAPADFYSLSFQLSYLATAGIFSAGVFFSEALDAFIPPKLCGGLSASLGAQAAIFPVSMSVFGLFAPAGTFATLILSAPISFFMISGIFCAALSALSPLLYSLCGLFMQAQYSLIFAVASFFARFPIIEAGRSPLFAPFCLYALSALLFIAGSRALKALRQKRAALW